MQIPWFASHSMMKRLKVFPLRSGTRQGTHFCHFYSIYIESSVPSNYVKKKKHPKWERRNKIISVYRWQMTIFYTENPKDYTHTYQPVWTSKMNSAELEGVKCILRMVKMVKNWSWFREINIHGSLYVSKKEVFCQILKHITEVHWEKNVLVFCAGTKMDRVEWSRKMTEHLWI